MHFHDTKAQAGNAPVILSSNSPLNEMALKSVHDCLKPIVRPQLPVDVVEMIAESLRTDAKCLCNTSRGGSSCEHPKDLKFLRC